MSKLTNEEHQERIKKTAYVIATTATALAALLVLFLLAATFVTVLL